MDNAPMRKRPNSIYKAMIMDSVATPFGENDTQQLLNKAGTFGRRWAKTHKKDKTAFPSLHEMMNSILKWYLAQLKTKMNN